MSWVYSIQELGQPELPGGIQVRSLHPVIPLHALDVTPSVRGTIAEEENHRPLFPSLNVLEQVRLGKIDQGILYIIAGLGKGRISFFPIVECRAGDFCGFAGLGDVTRF